MECDGVWEMGDVSGENDDVCVDFFVEPDAFVGM